MIATLQGTLAEREEDTIVVETEGGVGYAVTVSAGTIARLPGAGGRIALHTELVVREDGWTLFGFDGRDERAVFRKLLSASGFGPKLALAVVSTLGAQRTVRSIQAKDLAALSSVSGVGRKKAERLVLELQDKFRDVVVETSGPRVPGSEEAVRALVGLGYLPSVADDAVRAAAADANASGGGADPATLIRRALQTLAASRGGR
jgi:Holliday junction DNA helicase RuvA